MSSRTFDLNMKADLLEAWSPAEAIREIIANALDEQVLTETQEIDINERDEEVWVIRDYGRGLKEEHLVQNQNSEKLDNPDEVIGKFGVGLKDAIAVLRRCGVDLTIHSPHRTFTVTEETKANFDDIQTLHMDVSEPENPDMNGTEVVLDGVTEESVNEAKQCFLRYVEDEPVAENKYGELYKPSGVPTIYVTGIKIAEEDNFMYSYNITSTTKAIRDGINRERSRVSRSVYADRIKRILMNIDEGPVADRLRNELKKYEEGTECDEIQYKQVRDHAIELTSTEEDVVFATPGQQRAKKDMADIAEDSGREVVTIDSSSKETIEEAEDVQDIHDFEKEWQEGFEYDFVDEDELSDGERAIWDLRHDLLDLADGDIRVEEMRVSSTMRENNCCGVQGVWQERNKRIIIKRSTLRSLGEFARTFLHEAAHATSGAPDQSRHFENELSRLLGKLVQLNPDIAVDEPQATAS